MSGLALATPPIHVTVSTPGTPLWLTFLTLSISIAAVLISLWQTMANNAEQRRALPKVHVGAGYTAHYYDGNHRDARAVMLSAWNRGREATKVNSFIIDTPNATLNCFTSPNLISGPDLPFKLEPYSRENWAVDAQLIKDHIVDVHVSLGHGPQIHLRCKIDQRKSVTIGRRSKVLQAIMPPRMRSKFLETHERKLHVRELHSRQKIGLLPFELLIRQNPLVTQDGQLSDLIPD